MKMRITLSAVAAAVLVAACGGGSDFVNPPAPPPPTSEVPASASASIDGFIAYLVALVATPASTTDALEPVDTSMVTPPTDETSEPQKID